MSYYNFGLPPGEVPHNPLGLDVSQVGPHYRLLAASEIRARPLTPRKPTGIQVWIGEDQKGWWSADSNAIGNTLRSCYRVPASFPIHWDFGHITDKNFGLPPNCTPHNPDDLSLLDVGHEHRLLCQEEDWNLHAPNTVQVWNREELGWDVAGPVVHPTNTFRVPRYVPIQYMQDTQVPTKEEVLLDDEALFDNLAHHCAHLPWAEVRIMELIMGLRTCDDRATCIRRIQVLASKLS